MEKGGWVREAAGDLTTITGGYANHGYIGKHLKELVDAEGWENVRPAWQRYLRDTEPRYLSAPHFARSFGQWTDRPNGKVSQERAREMFRAAGLTPPTIMPEYWSSVEAVHKAMANQKRKAS